jgi:hypothetical protein
MTRNPQFVSPKSIKLTTKVEKYAFRLEDGLEWIKCRDRIASLWKGGGLYYRCKSKEEGFNTIQFLNKTEEIMDVCPSKFSYTNINFIIWVNPVFWNDCFIKRSLFTLLTRTARHYDYEKDNYEEALFEHKYLQMTKAATLRFLFGFTEFKGSFVNTEVGWRDTFKNKTTSAIISELKSSKKQIISPVGIGSVWK